MYHESAEIISGKKAYEYWLWTHFATKMFLHMLAVSLVRESHVCMSVFSLPALWVTDLPLCASAHRVQGKKLGKMQYRGEERKWIRWRRRNRINHDRLLRSPQWLPTALRESSLPQTIHHSNKCERFSQLCRDYPTYKVREPPTRSAHTVQRVLTRAVTSTSLKKLSALHLILSYSRWLLLGDVVGCGTEW